VHLLRAILFALLVAPAAAPAQDTLTSIAPVELRHFDPDRLEAYRSDPTYDYDRERAPAATWWELFKLWLREKIMDLLGTRAGAWVLDKIAWLIMAAALIIVLWNLRRGWMQRAFTGAPARVAQAGSLNEGSDAEDLDALIHEAEQRGEWRRALRLHYLAVLRHLSRTGLIQPAPGRTDREHLQRIADAGVRSEFARLSFTFKWVWYGEAAVGRAQYEALRMPFQRFLRSHGA
jgi:hypothetical protein